MFFKQKPDRQVTLVSNSTRDLSRQAMTPTVLQQVHIRHAVAQLRIHQRTSVLCMSQRHTQRCVHMELHCNHSWKYNVRKKKVKEYRGFKENARNVVRSTPAAAIQIRIQVDALYRVDIARATYGACRERRRTLVLVPS